MPSFVSSRYSIPSNVQGCISTGVKTSSLGNQLRPTLEFDEDYLTQPAKAGWFQKKGKRGRPYRRRYFILNKDKLFYFNEPPTKVQVPLGVIWLRDALVSIPEILNHPIQPGQYPFNLDTKTRVYDFAAYSEQERQEWFAALNTAIIDPTIVLKTQVANFSWKELPRTNLRVPVLEGKKLRTLTFGIHLMLDPKATHDYSHCTPVELRAEENTESSQFFRAKIAGEFLGLPCNAFFEASYDKPVSTECPISVTVRDGSTSVQVRCDPKTKMSSLLRALGPNASGSFLISGTSEYVLDMSLEVLGLRTVQRISSQRGVVAFELRPKQTVFTPSAPDFDIRTACKGLTFLPTPSISHRLVTKPFSVKVFCIDGFSPEKLLPFYERDVIARNSVQLVAEVSIFQGVTLLDSEVTNTSPNGMWAQTLYFPSLQVAQLPLSAKLLVTIWAAPQQIDNFSHAPSLTRVLKTVRHDVIQAKPLGSLVLPLFDYCGRLLNGQQTFPLLFDAEQANPFNLSSLNVTSSMKLFLELDSPPSPIFFNSSAQPLPKTALPALSDAVLAPLHHLFNLDPLCVLSEHDKGLIWAARLYCLNTSPKSLRFLVLSVDWKDPNQVAEFYDLLREWPTIDPLECFQLLDAQCTDPFVRQFAVKCLRTLSNDDLQLYLLQLIQTVKAEYYHFNPLVCFLLHRACLCRRIAQQLFYHILAELSLPAYRSRFALLLEALLAILPEATRTTLLEQYKLTQKLSVIARQIRAANSTDRQDLFQREATAALGSFFKQPSQLPSRPKFANLPENSLRLPNPSPPTPTVTSAHRSLPPPPKKPSETSQNPTRDTRDLPKNPAPPKPPRKGSIAPAPNLLSPVQPPPRSLSPTPPLRSPSPTPPLPARSLSPTPTPLPRSPSPTPPPRSPSPSPEKSFSLPTEPGIPLIAFLPEKSKVLTSATAPLWLTWQAQSSELHRCLFKVGDDLRQDALTLQVLTVMDKLWRDEGLNLNLTIYSCVPTSMDSGFIEAVSSSTTTADIHKAASNSKIAGGAASAFRKSSLANWLRENNPTAEAYDLAVHRFIRSCAGYSVATYVLGVGDRHNDNIMVSTGGDLFHIDFSNILGNIMKFGVYKRETAPFVLTPEFAHVMGGDRSPGWAEFKQLSCQAYLILRRKRDTLISLFSLMLSTGIPQLRRFEDLYHLRESLMVGKSEDEALAAFQDLIQASLENKRTQINNAIHLFANPN